MECRTRILLAVILVLLILLSGSNSSAWSNGGKSASATSPDYGTHDWIAQHASYWLPSDEKQYILDNLDAYLYGTELPDFSDAVGGDGIGDTYSHHVYYRSDGTLQDDSAASRARSVYAQALSSLREGNLPLAARLAGTMVHYIADVAAFPHVMGSGTDWGEENHHQDYETYVNGQTDSYSTAYDTYLVFDGNLEQLPPYEGTLRVAHDTTFDDSGHEHGAAWKNANYDWGNLVFIEKVGNSLNLAVNAVADVLHTLWIESGRQPDDLSSWLIDNAVMIVIIIAVMVMVAFVISRQKKKKRSRMKHR